MKNIFSLLAFLLAGIPLFAQTYTGHLTLSTQAEVDAFNYDKIVGSLTIKGLDIVNLDSLYKLDSIVPSSRPEDLTIDSTSIINVRGLRNLKTKYFRNVLRISNNPQLEDVSDLNLYILSLTNTFQFQRITIMNNPKLKILNPLFVAENKVKISQLIIEGNDLLEDINLYNSCDITSLTVKNNKALENITLPNYDMSLENLEVDNNYNLEAIRYIESPFYDLPSISITNNHSLTFIQELGPFEFMEILTIENNSNLINLDFIEKFSSIGYSRIDNLSINNNTKLTNCCGIRNLLQRNAYTTLSLSGNPFPCNDLVQVVSNCDTVPRNFVFGRVYIDANDNNQPDESDIFLKNVKIQTETKDQTLVHLSNQSGEYYFVNDTGSYHVQPIFTFNNIQSVPESHTLAHATFGNTDTLDFKITSDVLVNDASVVLSSHGWTRPARYNYYVITYGNESAKTYSGTISLKLDEQLTYSSASLPPTSVNGNVLTWDISNLPMFTSNHIVVHIVAPSTLATNDVLFSEVEIGNSEPDVKPNNNKYTFKDVVRASFDPNDKIVDKSILSPTEVADSTYLYYTIRFQNIGNDTAFHVFIYDSLDANLDWNTFDIVASSHDFEFEQLNGVRVQFDFKDILLPDSNVNEEGSHGFITYKIRPKNDLTIGDVIRNKASITFDVNSPIITNTTVTAIMETDAGIDRTICQGESIVLTASGATDYTWNDGSHNTAYSVSPDTTTTYYLIGVVEGVIQTDSVIIFVNPTKETHLTETLSQGGTYNFNGTILTETGIYIDTLLQQNGCDSIIILNLTVITSTKNQLDFVNSMKIFPNPTSNSLSIDLKSEKEASFIISLFSIDGKTLMEKNYQKTSTIQDKLDLSKFSEGIYFLRVEAEGEQATYNIIKQ